MHLYYPKMCSVIKRVMNDCEVCQREKLPGPQYGHLSPQEATLLPWGKVVWDLFGPWTVNSAQESYEFYNLTCIDPVTNFPDTI
jgi:hypothetical protein